MKPLIGKNKIELNNATVMKAIQYYFDKVVFADNASPKIESTEYLGDKYSGFSLAVWCLDSCAYEENK